MNTMKAQINKFQVEPESVKSIIDRSCEPWLKAAETAVQN